MLSETRDTIVALSTPPGTGGVAVVRLSGPRAFTIAKSRLRPTPTLRHARAKVRWYHTASGQRLDHVLALPFLAPRSYTGEDVLELHLHGSPWLVEQVLADLRKDLALATPGEFTRRAVENGRLSLTQAEGVGALLAARGPLAHRLALRSLDGGLNEAVTALQRKTLDLLALIEAELDFSEHEIAATSSAQLREQVKTLQEVLTGWRASWRVGRLAQGAQVVLVGLPNAGKSSLLNALAGVRRVLVDEEPGTTRDAVSHELVLRDVSLTLWDTAGLREDTGRVERLGVLRTRELMDAADLLLHVRAPGQPDMPELADRRPLRILTMVDLPGAGATQEYPDELPVSSRTGQGLDVLRDAIHHRLLDSRWEQLDVVLSEARHLQLVETALAALTRCDLALAEGLDRSLVADDVREAAEALGELRGGTDFEQMYDTIFSRFCVGK